METSYSGMSLEIRIFALIFHFRTKGLILLLPVQGDSISVLQSLGKVERGKKLIGGKLFAVLTFQFIPTIRFSLLQGKSIT